MRRLFHLVTVLVLACLCTMLASGARAEKRVALVIGNAAYQHAAPLANTLNDAKAIATLLTKSGFDVVESRSDLGVLDFKRALRDFVHTASDADIAVVYYAGHGIEVRGSNYLVPVDAKLASDYDADDEAVTLERIVQAVEPVKQLRLIILDACRDNPFLGKMQRAIAQRAVNTGLAPVEPAAGNTLIAFAAKAGSTSYDGAGSNSPFTSALVKHIAEPGLDIRIALGRVRDDVIRSTGHRQEPFIYGSLGGSTLALVPSEQKTSIASADPLQVQQADYEFAERVGTHGAWAAFLTAHPRGFYAELARAQMAKVGNATKSDVSGAPASAAAPASLGAGGAASAVPAVIAQRPPNAGGAGREARRPPPPVTPKPGGEAPHQEARLDFGLRPAPQPEANPEARAADAIDPCKRDEDKLARLRANPNADAVLALERSLGCPRLRPQVTRLRESVIGVVALPAAPAPAAANPVLAGDQQRAAAAPTAPAAAPAPTNRPAAAPSDAATKPVLSAGPSVQCKTDQDRLNALRAQPVRSEVLRFERELGCEMLRAQVMRLKESLPAH